MPPIPPTTLANAGRLAAACLCALGVALGEAAAKEVADTKFSADRGFYAAPFLLEISTATDGATVRYTLDGSRPTLARGQTYTGPLVVNRTVVVRAAAFKDGLDPTDVDTQTYLFLDDVIRQTGAGWPADWGSLGEFDTEPGNLPPGPYAGDYAMDPDVVDDPRYATTIKDDLRSIPSLVVALHPDDLFSDEPLATDGEGQVTETRGIYPIGKGFERAASAELILPDGSTGFQIDCSVEVQGATSTDRWKTDKLSMRLKFKSPYGPSELDYPLFGDDATDSINTVILDATNQQAWTHPDLAQQLRAQYIRDQFVGDLQNAAGGIAPHGRHAHVYLNGLYWGVYWLHEFVEEGFVTAYRGGEKSDYDILRHRADNVVAGSADGYAELLAAAAEDMSQLANYQAVGDRLDIPAFADYILINFYAGNADWAFQNWNASAHRSDPARRWLFHNWDAEKTFQFVGDDNTAADDDGAPTAIHQRLRASEEYRLAFADRCRKHLFNGGVLTPGTAAALYLARLSQIDRAVVGESARWGDNRNPGGPLYTRDTWLAERDRLLASWFPGRSAVLLGQLQADGLYPATPAPDFSQHGGTVPAGFVLTISDPSAAGQIYFTTDASDPRNMGGAVSAAAIAGSALTIDQSTRVKARTRAPGGEWSALTEALFLVAGALDDLRVTELMFNPVELTEAEAAAGFDDADGFEFVELRNVGASVLQLAGAGFAEGITFVFGEYALGPGERVLVVNDLAAFEHRYGAGALPVAGEYGGTLSNAGETVSLAGPFGEPVQSFTYDDSWYPTTDGGGRSLVVVDDGAALAAWGTPAGWRASTFPGGSPGEPDAPVPPLRITEIHYDPREPNAAEQLVGFTSEDEFEFVEVRNIGPDPLELAGFSLSGAAEFTFGQLTLGAGGRAVVVADSGALAARYGGGITVAGEFSSGPLSNSGDRLVLSGAAGEVIHDFSYDDDWYPATDGAGASLVVVDDGATLDRWGDAVGWEASVFAGGSPGAPEPVASSSPLRITEIMFNPGEPTASEAAAGFDDNDAFEFIELTNIGEVAINLIGHRLLDGVSFVFPSFAIDPGERVVVVKDEAAFAERYGTDDPVVGEYGGNLTNSDGEVIELRDPGGLTVLRFAYSDSWYDSTDGGGRSLTIVDPRAHRVFWGDRDGWRPSGAPGGSPGLAPDPYSAWAWSVFDADDALDPLVSGAGADPDADGRVNFLEYAGATDPLDPRLAGSFWSLVNVGGELYLALTFRMNAAATDLWFAVDFSGDGRVWSAADLDAQTYISGAAADGTPRATVIDSDPLSASFTRLVRLRVER